MKNLLLMTLIATSIISTQSFARSKGIYGMSEATSGIFRGARPLTIDEMNSLSNKGIKSILNLQGGDRFSKLWKLISWNEPGENQSMIDAEKSVAESLNMNFFNAPLNSLDPVTTDEDKFIDASLEYLHNKDNQPVYLHCEHGIDRTGLIVALYKVKYEGISAQKAHDEWVARGHDIKSQILTGGLDIYFYEKIKEFKK